MSVLYSLSDDVELLSDLRLSYIRYTKPEMSREELAAVRSAISDFIGKAVSEGRYLGFIGEEDGKIACSAALFIYDLPPYVECKPRRVGTVLSFSTVEEKRRRGYGYGLMEFIKRTAKERGFDRLVLNATPAGYPLYLKCGFSEAEEKALCLFLNEK